jgi:hypothetical protein
MTQRRNAKSRANSRPLEFDLRARPGQRRNAADVEGGTLSLTGKQADPLKKFLRKDEHMTVKEHLDSHLKKSSVHHDAMARANRRLAECHKAAANAHENQTIASAHRELSEHHESVAKAHQARQEDFEALREQLAAGSGAEVFDSREGETRNMQHAAGRDGFLKRVGLLD